jgi:hypothetical protein
MLFSAPVVYNFVTSMETLSNILCFQAANKYVTAKSIVTMTHFSAAVLSDPKTPPD